jgi:RNA polymerase sigma-70 factor (ECF subfamily)
MAEVGIVKQGILPDTSSSLLDRLRLAPADQEAWVQFVDRYGPVIYDWCRQWQLQDADSSDVTQAVLVSLVRQMRSFRYDPARSFRRWLWTVARHAWGNFLSDRRESDLLARSGAEELLEDVAARDDLFTRLDSEFDRELVEEAKARVQLRVELRTWEAFQLTAIDLLSGAETAIRLGMSVGAVFKAKSKVLRMLRSELLRLEGNEGEFHQ